VTGIPSSALIGPDGKIAWVGHPGSLSKGKVKEVLKGAKKRSTNFMAVTLEKEPQGRLAAAGKSMAQGDLGKALPAAQGRDRRREGGRHGEGRGHGARRGDPGARQAPDRPGRGLRQVEGRAQGAARVRRAGQGARGELGAPARKRAEEIRKDANLAKEIAGAEALERAQEQAAKLGSGKAKGKYQEVIDKHKGTRAAERAQAILRAKK
jgi:hypothetical protein